MKSINKIITEEIRSYLNKKSAFGQYECLNRGNGCYSNIAKGFNGIHINVTEDKVLFKSDTLLTERIGYTPDADKKGGIIVFSTDVNAVKLDGNSVLNFIKQKVATIVNRLNAKKKIDKIAVSNALVGWTIGRYLEGRYTAKNRKQYGENSISVEIIGVDSDTLVKIAESLLSAFSQEAVLVKDYSSNGVYFIER